MIPFNCESCFEAHNIFSISSDPLNKYYSAISTDSIFVFDASDSLFPLIDSFRRSDESIKNQGTNHWMRWMDKSTIAYGTCAGSFFTVRFENNKFSDSFAFVNVGGIVSDTFFYDNLIGICIIGPKIVFVNSNAEIVSTLSVPLQSPFIKSPSVCLAKKPDSSNNYCHYIIFISDGKLIKAQINRNEINDLVHLNYNNIGIVASNKDVFAFSTFDRSVYLSANNKITKILSPETNIAYMEFINDGKTLLMIDQNGVFILRNFIFNTNFTLALPDTKTMISSFYDSSCKRFFFLDPSYQIRCINFVELVSSFAFGSSFIYSLTKQSLIFQIPNQIKMDSKRKIRSIPSDLYPIKSIATNTETVFCIIGKIGISVITDYSLFYESSISADYVTWINNMLAVFCEKNMNLYTDELMPIGSLEISDTPLFVFSSGTRLILTFIRSFVVYEFDNSKSIIDGGNKKKHKVGKISFNSSTFKVDFSMKRSYILWNNEIFIQLQNGSVINFKANTTNQNNKNTKVVWDNVTSLWANKSPELLCCYRNGSVNILSENSMATLPLNSLWTINKSVIHIPSTLQYECIKANFTDFSPKMLPLTSEDHSKYSATLIELLNSHDFKATLNLFLDNLKKEKKLDQFYYGITHLSSENIVNFLNEMNDEYICYLAEKDFDFTSFFESVKPSIQSRILMHAHPNILNKILESFKDLLQEKEERFKNFVCSKCIKTGQFIRGCTFANSADYNFCQLLYSNGSSLIQTSLFGCLNTIEKDFNSWNEDDKESALKVVGCSFNFVKLYNWALACFLILKDEGKVVSLLTDNAVNLITAMRYTRDHKETSYSQFLFGLDIGL